MDIDKAVERIADEYRAEGYQVTVRPNDAQVPSFAVGFHLDLLATKSDERVLVQVKKHREDLQKDPQSMHVADVVNAQPGWRLDLVVLNGDSATEKLARELPEPSVDAILRNLDHAEDSARTGDHDSAFIIAWAALEAAMRRAARSAGIQLQNISPLFLLSTLYSNGLLERSEFDQLSGYLRFRDAIVHGLEAPKLDAIVPQYVASTARKLLAEAGQTQVSR